MNFDIHGFGRNVYKSILRPVMHWKNSLTVPGPKLLILLYHRILPRSEYNRLNTVVSRLSFEKHLDEIAREYRIASLNEVSLGGVEDEIRVVLTFDDGYWDNFDIVFPILKRKGIPAAFFLATDYIDGKARFSDRRLIDKKTGQPYKFIKDRFISWDQVRKMSEAGMEIGSHGITHNSLARMAFGEAKREICRSKKIIEERTGRPCSHFSFPFGSRSDHNDELVRCVKEAGFKTCMLNVHGYNYPDRDNFCFKRIIMEETTNPDFLLG